MTHTFGARIVIAATAAVLALFGVYFFLGGIWLGAIGGSTYYGIAGAALLLTAGLVFARRGEALWLFAALLLGTLGWALWESGSISGRFRRAATCSFPSRSGC